MAEKAVEGYLRDEAKRLGGKAYKFVSPGNDGVPDRLVCLPGGRISFVEIKDLGKTSTPLQKKQQAKLRALGFAVYEDVDSKEKVDTVLARMGGRPPARFTPRCWTRWAWNESNR